MWRSRRAAQWGAAHLVAALLLALSAACAPRLAPPGPGTAMPRLTDGALVTFDGLELPLRAWLPEDGAPKAVILALHGFNDYSNAFEGPGRYWAARGIATYAYDQRGFGAAPNRGLWAGAAAMTADLGALARLLRARHQGVPLYLLGDSMGGAVVLAALAGPDAPPADGVILVAPAVWARETMPLSHRVALWLGAHTVPWLTVTGRNLKIRASDNIEMLRELGRDPLVIKETRIDAIHGLVDLMDEALRAAPALRLPALLLYGEKDDVIPEDPTLRLWTSLPEAARRRQRRALYPNGWHMLLRDLEADVVLGDIAHWIADRRAPLPSGAEERALARINGGAM
ncbi:MAG: alpha/beta fold hydrolase [Kiloniellaceae bacterium]